MKNGWFLRVRYKRTVTIDLCNLCGPLRRSDCRDVNKLKKKKINKKLEL